MLFITYLNNFFNLIIWSLSQAPSACIKSSDITFETSPTGSRCILILNIINLLKTPYSKYIKPIQIRRFIIVKKRELANTFKKTKSHHNSFCNYTNDPEKWMLYFTTDKKLIQRLPVGLVPDAEPLESGACERLHGKNCSFCGNYIRDGILHKNYSEKILCKCIHNKMVNYHEGDGYNFYCYLEDDI